MAEGKTITSSPLKVACIRFMIKALAKLPLFITRPIGRFSAFLTRTFKTRAYRISQTNIDICLPELTDKEKDALINKSLCHTGVLFSEVAKIWCKPCIADWIDEVHGLEQVHKTLEQGSGVLFTGSQIGNWEVALFFLGQNFDFSCMYRPPRQLEMDHVISKGRCKNTTNMVRGDVRGVLQIIKCLRLGKVAALLSDQEPGRNAGVYAPFFGKEALTMTLVQKLHIKGNAQLFQIAAIRNQSGKFDIYLEPIVISTDLPEIDYAAQVNQSLEFMIKRFPEQYQWAYKRFRTTEDGSLNVYLQHLQQE